MRAAAARNLSYLGRRRKRALVICYDALAMALCLWLAFCIRLGQAYWPADARILWSSAAAIGIGSVALNLLGTYRVMIRYFDVRAASNLAWGSWAAATIWFVVAFVSRVQGLPRSVGFIYFALLFLAMFFGRLGASHLLVGSGDVVQSIKERSRPRIGVAIYGVNAAAAALVESLRRDPKYVVRYLIDETEGLAGRSFMGLAVRSASALREGVAARVVQQVLLAIPSSTRAERLQAISSLSSLSVPVLTIPSSDEIMSGRFVVSDVRPVRVEDLLKRDIVPPHNDLIEQGIDGNAILITGAGGSIGSEICRQILRYSPARMVLFDHSEFALYTIESELTRLKMAAQHLQMPSIHTVMGSVLDEALVASVLERHRIDTVFHAAAYKHVPLLENNEIVAAQNNVIGTKLLADACAAAGVARFTMVSTDKAVRPTSVMGATKRAAELYIQALAREDECETCFGIVRFGNVLDSSGSVVQQFREQIERGGPVTVTHPDVTRFFMSIPEATQLVLQANSLARGGEVFVLDMGEPVRITDLARTMITLAGLTERTDAQPHGDIEIDFVGLRPGEKLYEELFVGNSVQDTLHPQIKMARERSESLDTMQSGIRALERALKKGDAQAVRALLHGLASGDRALAA